jgi:hypothetical protein
MSVARELTLRLPRQGTNGARRPTRWASTHGMIRFAFVIAALLAIGLSSIPSPHHGSPPVRRVRTAHDAAPAALPFSPTSFWNTPLPNDLPADPRSDQLVSNFNQQWQSYYGAVGINIDSYSISTYRVDASTPRTRVGLAAGCGADAGLQQQLASVPIPADARPANGGDHSLVIWQPSSDTEWELWEAHEDAVGNWTACWGGRITSVSRSHGVFPAPYGLSASGLSYLGGTIKAHELQSGHIDHVIAVNVVETTAGQQVAPADRNDGKSTSSIAIPEGTRFRLDPTVDVTQLDLSPVALTIARALQRYGMVVTDTSGAVVLMAEDAQPFLAAGIPDPYVALFAGAPSYEVLNGMPWSRLQVVPPAPAGRPRS